VDFSSRWVAVFALSKSRLPAIVTLENAFLRKKPRKNEYMNCAAFARSHLLVLLARKRLRSELRGNMGGGMPLPVCAPRK
jgi:hypothetical protein